MNHFQHIDLLLRFNRAFNLRRAIETALKEGDRVMDAGCGLGILSMWAVRAGAAHVTSVDREGVELARALAEENGLGDRIEFRHGDLWHMQPVPTEDRVDILLAMVYLNDPRRDESLAELSFTVKRNWLRPGGRMIPERVEYTVEALDWPEQDYPTLLHQYDKKVVQIEQQYGLQFDALRTAINQSVDKRDFPIRLPDGTVLRPGARILSEPMTFCDIDYTAPGFEYPAQIDLPVICPGTATVLLWTQKLWFQDLLLFRNESITWIQNPTSVKSGSILRAAMDDTWRKVNRVRVELLAGDGL